MKKLFQVFVVFVGLGSVHALFDCPGSLVGQAGKPNASLKTKNAFRKCVNPEMESKNPHFTEALVKACDKGSFKKLYKKQCDVAAKAADPDSAGGSDNSDGDDASSKSSGGGDSSSGGDKTCTCICQAPPAQGYGQYAPQPPSYPDPYGQQQQQYQQPYYGQQ